MSTPLPQLPIGQVIGSRYRIQSLIGRGGMGMVYAATHELTGRRVALKLVLTDSEESPLIKERFLSEARIAAAVVHPNIVDVLDMGVHEGVLFLVMELLEGLSLERMLEAQTRLLPEQTFGWLLPIMGALATLHDAGIVHRDVKPSNIFLSSLPRHPVRPKLLDFGLARVVSDLRLTRSGTVIGTPLYMAPEHAAGHVAGPQADVWSVGVVLFECLAGTSPFRYTDRSSLAAQVLAGQVQSLAELRPDLPPMIPMVVARALHRDLSRRYQDMRAFAHALYAAGAGSGISMPRDPDPIGLPDYASWESSADGLATTHDHARARLTGSDPFGLPRNPSSGSLSPPSAVTTERGRSPSFSKLVPALVVLMMVGAALATWWFASDRTPAQQHTAPTPAAVTPAPSPTSPAPSEPLPALVEPLPRPTVAPEPESKGSERPASSPERPSRRESSSRRRTAERGKADKLPSSAEKRPAPNVEEVESEWK
jgi:eukaryotic-like serine/threonine-protein kinase